MLRKTLGLALVLAFASVALAQQPAGGQQGTQAQPSKSPPSAAQPAQPAQAGQQAQPPAKAAPQAQPTPAAVPQTHLKVGDPAPEFVLRDTEGKEVKLSDFKGKKNVVLAFYVLAFTGG